MPTAMKAFLSRLKALVFRAYYRYVNQQAWRDHDPGPGTFQHLMLPTEDGDLRTRMYHGGGIAR